MKCQQALSINCLPEEILQKIVFLLPSSDLKSAVLVCRRWHRIAMEPKLWTDFMLCINYKNMGMMRELLRSERLRLIKSIKFLTWFVPVRTSEAVIKEISKHGEVEELIIRGHGLRSGVENLADVDPKLLSSCINKMRKVSLSKTAISKDQVNAVFTDMSEASAIEELDIRENDFSSVADKILETCLHKMRVVTLSLAYENNYQKERLVREIRRMSSVDIRYG